MIQFILNTSLSHFSTWNRPASGISNSLYRLTSPPTYPSHARVNTCPSSSHCPNSSRNPSAAQYGLASKDGIVAPTEVTQGEAPTTSGTKVQSEPTALLPLSPLATRTVRPGKCLNMSQPSGEKLEVWWSLVIGFHAWGFGLGYLESFI